VRRFLSHQSFSLDFEGKSENESLKKQSTNRIGETVSLVCDHAAGHFLPEYLTAVYSL
jgi:hypothetical protein